VIRPEDRLARLLARLDRLPRAARRALVLLLPLALLAALVASVVFVPRNEHHRTRAAATPTHVGTATTKPPVSSTSPPGKATATPEPVKPAGGDVGDRQVAAAIDPARGFIESYVAIAYGRARPRAIRGADPKLVRTLVAGRSRVSRHSATVTHASWPCASPRSPRTWRRRPRSWPTAPCATRSCSSSTTGAAGGW
jgi:hypothetical protein